MLREKWNKYVSHKEKYRAKLTCSYCNVTILLCSANVHLPCVLFVRTKPTEI